MANGVKEGKMNVGKQLLLALSIYVVSAAIIEGVLWYFNPSLNEFVRPSIITFSSSYFLCPYTNNRW